MQVSTLLLETALLVSTTLANFDLCARCNCTKDVTISSPLSKFIDCSKLSLSKIPEPDIWPEFLEAERQTTLLDFEYNNLQTIPQFPALKSITGLCLRHNKINKMAEAAFVNLERLKMLDLSHNDLATDEIRADVFRGRFGNDRYEALGIVSLNLGYNRIRSLGERSFEHLPDLQVLYLDGNALGVVDAATEMALASLTSLKVLDLGYTQLSELPGKLVHSLGALREFYLNGNNFRKVPESLAALGSSLERLNLNDNKMTSLDDNSFLGLGRLKQLNISACSELVEVLPGTFGHLASLESLYLSFNYKLSYVSADAFRQLKDNWPVKQLFLHQNALTSLPEKLLPWEQLEVLDIQENPWRCDCQLEWLVEELVPRLRREMPDLVTDIRCDQPRPLRGEQLMTLNSTLLCAPSEVPRRTKRGIHFHPVTLTLVMLSLLVAAVAIVTVCRRFYVRKANIVILRDVRYTRQVNELEDDDYS